jgi:hypothetical protein
VFGAGFEQSRVKLSSGDGNCCGNKYCRILTVLEVLRKLKQVLVVNKVQCTKPMQERLKPGKKVQDD